MSEVHIINHQTTIANQFLYELRHKDIQKDRARFRANLKKLGSILAYEISKTLNYKTESCPTPITETRIDIPEKPPLLVTILRASVPFFNGFIDFYDHADVAFIGAYREEGDNVSIKLDYLACPDITNRDVIIVDPMLATGQSLIAAYNQLVKRGEPAALHFASAIAAPEGIDYIAAHLSRKYTIWTAALDEKLNEKSYIVPGLGDAGDLSFGEKL